MKKEYDHMLQFDAGDLTQRLMFSPKLGKALDLAYRTLRAIDQMYDSKDAMSSLDVLKEKVSSDLQLFIADTVDDLLVEIAREEEK